MLIAIFAGLFMLFGGSESFFGEDIEAITTRIEIHVSDQQRAKAATESLNILSQESESLDEKLAAIAEKMKSVHFSHSSTAADYSKIAQQSESAFDSLIEASFKTRIVLKENITREEWLLIYPRTEPEHK